MSGRTMGFMALARKLAQAAAVLVLGGAGAFAQPAGGPWQQWAAASPLHTAPPPATPTGGNVLQMFATYAQFQAATAHIALTHEDFSSRGMGTASPCWEPVNSEMGQPGAAFLAPVCFEPGQVKRGFSIRSNLDVGAHGYGLMAFAAPIGGLQTNVVGAISPATITYVDFDDGPVAVAMQAFDWQAGSPLTFTVTGRDNQVLGSFMLSGKVPSEGVFAGFISPVPVQRVEVRSLSGVTQMIGNLRFGGHAGGYRPATAALHFGAVAAGGNGQAILRLAQTGDLPVAIDPLPAPPAPFAVVDDGCSGETLAVGGDCDIVVGFSPALVQAHRAIWVLPAIDTAGDDEAGVVLTGRGALPRLHVETPVLDFGGVEVGQPATATLVLRNVEPLPLAVQGIGAVVAPFAAVAGADACAAPPFVLQPGESCALHWQVTPAQDGEQRARVLVSTDDPSSPRRILLRAVAGDVLFADGFE